MNLFKVILSVGLLILTGEVASAQESELSLGNSSNNIDILFLFIGGVMVFSMHAGFAFLELGTVRKKNQVNALQKIFTDWSISTVVYFFIGFPLAQGVSFMVNAETLALHNGHDLIKFFFYLTFAACIPAIISGGIAERAKFWPIIFANAILVGIAYPFVEGAIWWQYAMDGDKYIGIMGWVQGLFGGEPFTDFAGSVVVHSFGGWVALPAILLLGPRLRRYKLGAPSISNIPFLALGSWILCIGWFGFNVISAAELNGVSGLVAVNSLMAMVGGLLASVLISKNDAGFTHNGALAGLIAICSGSAVVHPLAAFAIGAIGGLIFFFMYEIETERFKIDDVLGVWPLHGIVGTWGGISAGVFGNKEMFGAAKNLNFMTQFTMSIMVALFAVIVGFIVFGLIKLIFGIRLDEHDEFIGADRAIHHIEAYPEESL